MILRVLPLLAVLVAVGSTQLACKTCDVHLSDDTATGSLTYTEPVAALEARKDRLARPDETDRSMHERARGGEARVVDEARPLDEDSVMYLYPDGRPTLVSFGSTVKKPFHLWDDEYVDLAISTIRVEFARPDAPGSYDLTGLRAQVCERIRERGDRGDESRDVCGPLRGSVKVRTTSDTDFDGDLVLEGGTDLNGPSVSGKVTLHHRDYAESTLCSDLH